jgi:spore maturation protein CgeB
MDFTGLIKRILENKYTDIPHFRREFIFQMKRFISDLLAEKEKGSTLIFNLKKIKNTPFSKFYDEIIKLRRAEFENAVIKKIENRYDISELLETYYGQKFKKIADLGLKKVITAHQFVKIEKFAQKLHLNLNLN